MASRRQRSPGAAIREWLDNTDVEAKPQALRIHTEDRTCRWSYSKERRAPHRRAGKHDGRKFDPHNGEIVQSLSATEPKTRELESKEIPRLAERLGLHTPFQAMDDVSSDPPWEPGRPSRRQNGQENGSSELSSIEPPPMKRIAKGRKRSYDDRPRYHHRHSRRPVSRSASDSTRPSQASIDFQDLVRSLPPAELRKAYERRPRHKTRADRYELKEKGKQPKDDLPTTEPPRKKRKKKAKRRESYEHTFAAQNVASDRLTIRPTSSMGVFKKGRASSPVRRRGLPDLSFSELTFLNTSKAQSGNHMAPENKKTKKKDVNRDEELSRFFESTGVPTNRGRQGHTREFRSTRYDHERLESGHRKIQSSMETSPAAAAGLPDRPFLGFGEPGPRPPSLLDPNEIPPSINSSARRAADADASTSRSTSYFTWSRSSATERGFINRIPHHSTVVSPSKAEKPLQPDDKIASTPSKSTLQQYRVSTEIGIARKRREIVNTDPKHQMYGALRENPNESMANSLSPRSIPASEDERAERKTILARRSREFDRRILKNKDGGTKSSGNFSVPVRKSRGPPVVMEGTEALTAVLDSWFEKHERRFVRLATARTDSPDQSQGRKEAQGLPSAEENPQDDAMAENSALVTRPVPNSREHSTGSPSRLQRSPKPESANKQPDDDRDDSPHASPKSPAYQAEELVTTQTDEPVSTRHDEPKLRDRNDSTRTAGTDYEKMSCSADQFPEKTQSPNMTSVNPQMRPRCLTAPSTHDWHLQTLPFSTTAQQDQPQTIYGQHIAGGFARAYPDQYDQNLAYAYSETLDAQYACSPFDPNLNYVHSEYIESDPQRTDFGGRYQGGNAKPGRPITWRGSASSRDCEQHLHEDVLRKGFDNGQEMHHGNHHGEAWLHYKDVEKPSDDNERLYLVHQTDYTTPEHSRSHSSYMKSPSYLSEKTATTSKGDFTGGGPYPQEPFESPGSANTLRIQFRAPRSTERLFRPRGGLTGSLDELEVPLPSDFWRPALY